MPPKTTATATPVGPKRFERRVHLGGGAGFVTRHPGPDGRLVDVVEHGNFGDLVVLDAMEQMRLDSLGALAAAGATREDVEAAFDQRVEAYRSGRRGLSEAP